MTSARDPLAGVELLLVDGSNLLYAMRRRDRGDESAPAAPAAVIGRLRAVVPAATEIQLLLDGPTERGLGTARIAAGVAVRYSGRRSADDAIVDVVRGRAARGTPDRAILVVTDDGDLGREVRGLGARTAGTEWLIGRLGRARLSSPAAGRTTPPPPGLDRDVAGDEEPERRAWRPGRGATVKRGNPRRRTSPWRRR